MYAIVPLNISLDDKPRIGTPLRRYLTPAIRQTIMNFNISVWAQHWISTLTFFFNVEKICQYLPYLDKKLISDKWHKNVQNLDFLSRFQTPLEIQTMIWLTSLGVKSWESGFKMLNNKINYDLMNVSYNSYKLNWKDNFLKAQNDEHWLTKSIAWQNFNNV